MNMISETQKHKSVLIINNYGIGNFIILLPILSALKSSQQQLKIYCLENHILHTDAIISKVGLKKIDGFVPAIWRRFLPENRADMIEFLIQKKIYWILNFRLEAPELDGNYFSFKNEVSQKRIECWDLYDFEIATSQIPISKMICKMLMMKGLKFDGCDNPWMITPQKTEDKKCSNKKTIGFFLGASREIKRWFAQSWIHLITKVLNEFDHEALVYAGDTPDEIQYARHIVDSIHYDFKDRITFIAQRPLPEVLESLSSLSLLVSHDTFASHVAAAANIPAVGLYIATDSRIWAPVSRASFISIQSNNAINCQNMKIDGTCTNYYHSCIASCADEIHINDVFNSLKTLLKQNAN